LRHRISKKCTSFACLAYGATTRPGPRQELGRGARRSLALFPFDPPRPSSPPHHARVINCSSAQRHKDALACWWLPLGASPTFKAGPSDPCFLAAQLAGLCRSLARLRLLRLGLDPFRSRQEVAARLDTTHPPTLLRPRGGAPRCLPFVHLARTCTSLLAAMGSSCVNLSRAVLFAGGRRGHQYGRGGVLHPSPSLLSRRHGNAAVACCSSGTGSRPSSSSSSFPAGQGLEGDSGAAGSTTSPEDHAGGIGVAEFLGAKNFLITGGTGFLAKGDTSLPSARHVASES
jgi:hypothetical protein